MSLKVAWPFRLPEPSGDSGDPFGTEKDIEALQAGFRKYLLQQRLGRQLSNMLQKEFEGFLIVHLRITRWGPNWVSLVKTRAERRLAGRPTKIVDQADESVVRGTVTSIKATLDEIRAKIKIWREKNPTLDQNRLLKRISSEFGAKMRGWFSIFSKQVRALPSHEWRRGNFADLRSWSSREVAAQIANEYLPRERGIAPTLAQLRNFASSPSHKKVKTK